MDCSVRIIQSGGVGGVCDALPSLSGLLKSGFNRQTLLGSLLICEDDWQFAPGRIFNMSTR
jgi:hypothetical protein